MDICKTFERQMAKISVPYETNHHYIFALIPVFFILNVGMYIYKLVLSVQKVCFVLEK